MYPPPPPHTHTCANSASLYVRLLNVLETKKKKKKQNATPFDVEATKKSIVPHVRNRSGSDVA